MGFYRYIFEKEQPDYVLSYTIKPIVWAGIALRWSPNARFTALITGLGYAFQGQSFVRKVLRWIVSKLYTFSLKRADRVIFQNSDNLNYFVHKGFVSKSKTHIVNGSGVNTEYYNVTKLPEGHVNFLCVSRLLGEKGLREYATASKIVKIKFPKVTFDLVGPTDSSPDAISLEEVTSWSDYLKYNGATNDVRPFIEKCHVFVLPSYHEGLPRGTLEAMSMGRPVLTTDAIGCKETVEDGKNGFKVPVKSAEAIAKKMIWFIENIGKVEEMGLVSRKIVQNKFDVHQVNKEMLKIMEIE